MLTILERALFSSTLTAILVLCPFLSGQETQGVAPAPAPPQILAAKKVFIANAPGDLFPPNVGANNLPYDGFYAAVRSWAYYQLVFSPAEADLVFEISFRNSQDPMRPVLRLVIVDPKTQTPLWWFAEQIVQKPGMFWLQKSVDAFKDTIPKLVDDLKKLAKPEEGLRTKG